MHLPGCLWNQLQDFATRRLTGQVVLHFHEGRITRFELTQVQKVSRWDDAPIDHGMLITEDAPSKQK